MFWATLYRKPSFEDAFHIAIVKFDMAHASIFPLEYSELGQWQHFPVNKRQYIVMLMLLLKGIEDEYSFSVAIKTAY